MFNRISQNLIFDRPMRILVVRQLRVQQDRLAMVLEQALAVTAGLPLPMAAPQQLDPLPQTVWVAVWAQRAVTTIWRAAVLLAGFPMHKVRW